MKFTNVKDKLPKKKGRYLVVKRSLTMDAYIDIEYIDTEAEFFFGWGFPITHWAPLPDIPKIEK